MFKIFFVSLSLVAVVANGSISDLSDPDLLVSDPSDIYDQTSNQNVPEQTSDQILVQVIPEEIRRQLDSSSSDDCKIATSGSSICGLAYQTVMQNKYSAEACTSAYFYEIQSCQNINCVFAKMPRSKCSCGSTYDSMSYCLDYNSPTQICRSMLRLWLNACNYPASCIATVTNQIGQCPDQQNGSSGPFISCLNNAIGNATCNTDPARLFSSASRIDSGSFLVALALLVCVLI